MVGLCAASCYGRSCDEWLTRDDDAYYYGATSCNLMETEWDCDCSGCSCDGDETMNVTVPSPSVAPFDDDDYSYSYDYNYDYNYDYDYGSDYGEAVADDGGDNTTDVNADANADYTKPKCPETCYGMSCDGWADPATDFYYGESQCSYIEETWGCDCYGCECAYDTPSPTKQPFPSPTPHPTTTPVPTEETSEPTMTPVPTITLAPTTEAKQVYTYSELRSGIANNTILNIAADIQFEATPIVIRGVSDLTITSDTGAILDGRRSNGLGAHRLFDIQDSSITLDNLALRHGDPPDDKGGGCVKAEDSDLTIRGTNFTGCRAEHGGAIEFEGWRTRPTLAIDSSRFADNVAATGKGGAIKIVGAKMIISSSEFYDNTAQEGGAVDGRNGDYTILGSTFARNKASGGNGGHIKMRERETVATIDGSSFIDGRGVYGGAMYIEGSGLAMSNSYVSGNSANGMGPGIYLDAAKFTNLWGNKFSDNVQDFSGWHDDNPDNLVEMGVNVPEMMSGSGCGAGLYGECELKKNSYTSCTIGVCHECPVGTFRATHGASNVSECEPCPSGTFADKPGSTSCREAPDGTYTGKSDAVSTPNGIGVQSGASAAIPCPAGQRQPSSEDGDGRPWRCVPCEPGTSSLAGSTTCYECPSGLIAKNKGSDECLPCKEGEYAASTTSCASCVRPSWSSEGATSCQECIEDFYWDGNILFVGTNPSDCTSCPEGALCPHGTTLETLAIKRGYFRFDLRSDKVYPCAPNLALSAKMCVGTDPDATANHSHSLCALGHEGQLCATCSEGFFKDSLSHGCVTCAGSGHASPLLIAAVLLVIGGASYACRDGRPLHSFFIRQRDALIASMNYLITVFITITIIADLQRVHVAQGGESYPLLFRSVIQSLEVFHAFDFIEVFHLDCVASGLDYFHKLMATCLLPLVAVSLVLIGELVRVALKGGHVVRGAGTKWLLIFLFFALPSISRIISGSFSCDSYDFGDSERSFMRVDTSIECGTDHHNSIIIFAAVNIVVYPIGVTCLMAILLWSRRADIRTRATRDGDASLESLSFLFRVYGRPFYYMGIIDMMRRLLLGCFLLFLEKYDQILAAFIIATFFVVASREQQIHYTPDMDRVYHFCTWQPGLCVVALVIMDWFRAVSHDNFEHRENALSIVLIAANVGILGICGLSVDHKRRVQHEAKIAAIFDSVQASEREDKTNFDRAYAKLVADAPEGAETALLAALKVLVGKTKDAQVAQPPQLNTVKALLGASERYNGVVHAYIGAIVVQCGGVYHPGPVKLADRIESKANSDYGGAVRSVVDTVRGSGIFDSIVGYTRAVEMLSQDGPDKPNILRTKDKITKPLPNGYRDVLCNLIVAECDGLVCELQLHFNTIHDLKPMNHRIYKIKRAVGLDQHQSAMVQDLTQRKNSRMLREQRQAQEKTVEAEAVLSN